MLESIAATKRGEQETKTFDSGSIETVQRLAIQVTDGGGSWTERLSADAFPEHGTLLKQLPVM